MPPHSSQASGCIDENRPGSPEDQRVKMQPAALGGANDMTPLPEDFQPGELDVICSWARQNHRHSKSSMNTSTSTLSGIACSPSPPPNL